MADSVSPSRRPVAALDFARPDRSHTMFRRVQARPDRFYTMASSVQTSAKTLADRVRFLAYRCLAVAC
eukprot:1467947-Lingulodinium_polyedra.AAC.1